MKLLRLNGFLLLLLLCAAATAQDLSRLRFKTVPVSGDTLQLDSLSIVEGSLVVRDGGSKLIDTSAYTFDAVKSSLVWKSRPASDSVTVVYRTFPFSLARVVYKKNPAGAGQLEDYLLNPFSYIPPNTSAATIDFGSLEYNGSFARGLSFGNNQDVVLNSSFNLQIAGNITEDIEILAALTDNNIPIQPDGTTQQLQEFDRVYIQLTKQPHRLIVGDYDIKSPEGYFMKYYRNLQGASYSGSFNLSEKEKVIAQASIAVPKGRFNRFTLPVSEGNQGPYKLIGANGETFIIVLAGTERVFVNGRQIQRGAENDYVIDYNLGEIIFTPKLLVTRDLRITVEFEYSDRNYFRTTAVANAGYEREKVKFRVNAYTEQDSKNQPVDADFTAQQKGAMETAGDNPIGILYPGFELEEFDVDRILYALIDGDSLTPEVDTVFVYSTDPDSAEYRVNFTFVGQRQGDYVQSSSNVNGRVFRYIPRVNGTRQGSFIPFRVLVTPKRLQMVTAAMDLKPTVNDFFTIEGAVSNSDLNNFSRLDDGDNAGAGLKTAYQRNFRIGAESKKQKFTADANYEFVNHNFKELERFRTVEFNRDWNYLKTEVADEHIANARLNFSKEQVGNAGYQFSSFISGDNYTGFQHRAFSTFSRKGYSANVDLRFLTTEATTENTKYIWPMVEVAKAFDKLKGWKIGSRYEQEINKRREAQTDTLLPTGFVYNDWRVYIASADSAVNKMKLEYIRRLEFFPRENEMRLITNSNTVNVNGNWFTHTAHKLNWQFTYRMFESVDSAIQAKEIEHYYLGRIEYGLNLAKGAVNTNVLYELGAGREPRIEYTYLKVQPGEGIFIYNEDYNGNGVKDQNEFEIAPPGFPGDYIRVLNPTTQFDAVDGTQYNQSLSLNPRAIWNNKNGIREFIARFSSITSLQINRKVFRGEGRSPFNPFVFSESEQSLVSLGSLVRNSIFFNKSSAKYSFEYTYQDNQRKSNQVSGYETVTLRDHIGRARWTIFQPVSILLTYIAGEKSNSSQFFTERNYRIKSNEIEPQVTYFFGTKFRLTGLYSFTKRKNIFIENGETSTSNEASLEARYNVVSKSSLSAKFAFVQVAYTGSENSAIEFAMLQGFKNGNNYTWNASFERSLAKAIQLSIGYEGRKTGDAKPVHIGRAQVRAIF
ncbi:MAG: hypothetical protein SH857_00790 [Chitinophagales bacterium]|nr:hypothetical protein [Chitinophagales bacterium]